MSERDHIPVNDDDAALVERVAAAIWTHLLLHETGVWSINRDEPLVAADNFEGREFYLSPGPDVRDMARAAIAAVRSHDQIPVKYDDGRLEALLDRYTDDELRAMGEA